MRDSTSRHGRALDEPVRRIVRVLLRKVSVLEGAGRYAALNLLVDFVLLLVTVEGGVSDDEHFKYLVHVLACIFPATKIGAHGAVAAPQHCCAVAVSRLT